MKPGDLRRFKTPIRFSTDSTLSTGRLFVVVNIPEDRSGILVDMLVDGQLEEGWDLHWVLENSEPVDAAG